MSNNTNSAINNAPTLAALEECAESMARLRHALSGAVFGQDSVIEQMLITLLAGGHALLTGMPGSGKTFSVKCMAHLSGLSCRRIQFTPDLMPADIIGSELLELDDAGRRSFRFLPGPVFTNLLIADEINRTPPKTQAALLEAMGERQVSTGGATRQLPSPFTVLATRNPIESEGTYPLPEAQLDRFLLNITMEQLPLAEEVRMVGATTAPASPALSPVLTMAELAAAQSLAREIIVPRSVIETAVTLCAATRPGHPAADPDIAPLLQWGGGSRAAQALIAAGKARALLHGRGNVAREDIIFLLHPVLSHRLVLTFRARAEGWTAEKITGLLLRRA